MVTGGDEMEMNEYAQKALLWHSQELIIEGFEANQPRLTWDNVFAWPWVVYSPLRIWVFVN